ncbi:MAG: PQQ-binding-like beta-propeller repeat protein, partial [Verrucomicrobiota bacterium]
GVNPENGDIYWTVDGGGNSTPAVSGNIAIVHGDQKANGLLAYEVSLTGAKKIWSHEFEGRGSASPIVHEGSVYLIGGERAACCDLKTGKIHWEEHLKAEISSPILTHGKLIALTNNGGFLSILSGDPDAYQLLHKSRFKAARCPSPALADGRLYIRNRESIACFDLRSDP